MKTINILKMLKNPYTEKVSEKDRIVIFIMLTMELTVC